VATGIPGIALDVAGDAPSVVTGAAESGLRTKGKEFTTRVGLRWKVEEGTWRLFATDLTGDGVADLALSPPASTPASPDDAVIMDLGGVVAATIGMSAISPDPTGACLTIAAESVGLPPVILSFDPWPPFPDLLALRPAFDGTGTGQYTLQIFDDAGLMLFEQSGLEGIAGGATKWPRKWGKLGGQTPCFTVCYPDFTTFRTAAGLEFPVHEIRVLAEGAGPAPLIDSLRITASGLGELHLFDPVTTLPSFGVVCYPDCDGSGALDFFDFLCFLNQFGLGDPTADCDGTGTLDFFDFLCFQNAFAAGCP
jgi:hypothetical protein